MTAAPSGRNPGLDVGRGVLLVAMLAVHIVSAHGTAVQVGFLHTHVGVFLISSGFVGLSGYVVGMRAGGSFGRALGRGLDRGLQLILVMFAYGVLLSLARHGLALLGGEQACAARAGWVPPLRFEDLGILLPIGLVQILGPVSSQRGRWPLLVLAVLAVAWMTMPSWTSDTGGVLVDVFTRRSLTPFYTVSTFVAIGLVGVLLGRAHLRILDRDHVSPAGAIGSLAAAIVLSLPACSGAVLDPIYASAGALVGSLATLAYWSTVLLCLVRGFVAPWGVGPGGPREIFALLGRNSLLTFVLHDALLVVDAFARSELGIGKGSTALLVLFASNVVVLVIVVGFVERSRVAQGWVDGLLLGRSRRGSLVYGGAWSLPGAIALAGILAVYTSSALARPDAALVVDDFESEQCPKWWTFGFVPQERVAGDRGHYLRIHGAAPGTYAHGRGVYMDRDVGERDTLKLRVRGDGPGSGRLKIELSEDDNGNWEIEKQPPLYVPEYDDRFIHEVSVDWRGWRTLSIPLSAFRDDNPRKGNDIFDPERDLTSGGLLELQLLVTPSGALGDEVRIAIDDVRFTP